MKKKRSKPLRTVTQLRLVISLYLANGHTLSPTRLLLQRHSRVCLGKKLRGQPGRPRSPSQPPLPPTHPAQNKITTRVLRHPPQRGRETLQCSRACQGPAPGTASFLLLRCWRRVRTSVPSCGGAKPYSLALQRVPAGQEAKCTKILLIISLKRLRNKVVLFFFYNPSKKKVHISARAPNQAPPRSRAPAAQ